MSSLDLVIWGTRIGMRVLLGWFWIAQWGVSPTRRQRFHQFRRQLRSVIVDTDDAFRQSKSRDTDEVLAATERLLARHGDSEALARIQATRQTIREGEEEAETLRAIRAQAGGVAQTEIESYREYLAARPESRVARGYLVGALERAGEFEESLHWLRHEVQIAEGSLQEGFARVALARGLATAGRCSEAHTELETLFRDEPKQGEGFRMALPYAHLQRGRVLKRMGDLNGARAAWRQAARLDKTGVIGKHLHELEAEM